MLTNFSLVSVPLLSVLLTVSTIAFQILSRSSKLHAIPTVGSTTWVGSCWSAFKNLGGVSELVQEGYDKYKDIPFKIPYLYSWIVVVSGNKLLEEVRTAPDEQLSSGEANYDFFQIPFTVGHRVAWEPYHFSIIKTHLTRQLTALFPNIEDEITLSLSEAFGLGDSEWKSVVAFDSIRKVVSRTSSRAFFGLPLCRNSGWLELCVQFSIGVIISAIKLGFFPSFMWPVVAKFATSQSRLTEQAVEYLGPTIRERQKSRALHPHDGNQTDAPNDFLQWVIDHGTETSELEITQRMLIMVFASIHATSVTFLSALYNLAAYPEYLEPLREEVDSVVHQNGWTKTAIDEMHMIDNFLKESHRFGSNSTLVMLRKVMHDFTFSDGKVVPKGCIIASPTYVVHHDNAIYSSPNTFDPFRFARPNRDGDGTREQLISISSDFMVFGHGRHACPGRAFAALVQKTLLARIVTSYDLKLEDNAPRSLKTSEFGIFVAPDPTTRILMRRRL